MHAARRQLLRAAALGAASALGAGPALLRAQGEAAAQDAIRALREGGSVAVFRHTTAPGTFDPPGFRLDDCRTQRNLSEQGRDEARRRGAWFRSLGLVPAAVRSSPWCRCLDTARLAFETGVAQPQRVQSFAALGSPVQLGEAERARQQSELRAALAAIAPGRFEVWVTHQFVIQGLAGASLGSGEGLVLRAGPGGAVRVMAPLPLV